MTTITNTIANIATDLYDLLKDACHRLLILCFFVLCFAADLQLIHIPLGDTLFVYTVVAAILTIVCTIVLSTAVLLIGHMPLALLHTTRWLRRLDWYTISTKAFFISMLLCCFLGIIGGVLMMVAPYAQVTQWICLIGIGGICVIPCVIAVIAIPCAIVSLFRD